MPLNPGVTLQPHQARLRADAAQAAAADAPFARMLVWGVGSGKSIGALSAADALGAPAAAVVPAAIRPTIRGEAEKALGRTDFPVVSYQQAARGNVPPADTLIVDEAHRLGAGGPQAAAVMDHARRAKNLLLLTGTPVRNSPQEIAPLVSLVTGTRVDPDAFARRYVGAERVHPHGLLGRLWGEEPVDRPALVNTDELKHLLAGKVDYYVPETPPVGVTEETHEVELSPRQSELYKGFWSALPFNLRWKLKHRYGLTQDELRRFQAFSTGPRQSAISDYPWRPDGDAHAAFRESGKLRKAFDLLTGKLSEDPRVKAVVYSNFPSAAHTPYSAALTKAGVPHAVFDGTLSDEERKRLVRDFNEDRIRVALISPAAGEGVSLKGAQLVQLLDPAWNDAKMRQAAARAIRFDSHHHLPEHLRHVVVQKFVGRLPLGFKDRLLAALGVDRAAQRRTVDDHLMGLAAKKEVLNNQLLALLKEVSDRNRTKAAADRVHAGDAVRLAKLAALVPGVPGPAPPAVRPGLGLHDKLRLAKSYSDLGTPEGYAAKTELLRAVMRENPRDWHVDQRLNAGFVGVRHVSGWRYHLPAAAVADLAPHFSPPPAGPAPPAAA